MAGKSAHFQITLALELDFIHSCTHDSHCKMLEHWQHHKSVTTVKDALTLLSTVRSRYTKQFTLELAGQDISQHNWNLIIEGSEMWTSSRLGTWWVVSWHDGLKNGMPNVLVTFRLHKLFLLELLKVKEGGIEKEEQEWDTGQVSFGIQ